MVCECIDTWLGLGSDNRGDHADGLDPGRGRSAAQLDRPDRNPCHVLHRGQLWVAALPVFANPTDRLRDDPLKIVELSHHGLMGRTQLGDLRVIHHIFPTTRSAGPEKPRLMRRIFNKTLRLFLTTQRFKA